jgi:phage terminase large subunit-like protein
MPDEVVALREAQDNKPYAKWIRDGWIETFQGKVLHDGTVVAAILDGAQRCTVANFGYDPAFAQYAMGQETLQDLPAVKVRMTSSQMNEAMRRLEALVLDGNIDHGFNPVARSHFEETLSVASACGRYVRPGKRAVHTAHNDGAVAALTAVAAAIQYDQDEMMPRVYGNVPQDAAAIP